MWNLENQPSFVMSKSFVHNLIEDGQESSLTPLMDTTDILNASPFPSFPKSFESSNLTNELLYKALEDYKVSHGFSDYSFQDEKKHEEWSQEFMVDYLNLESKGLSSLNGLDHWVKRLKGLDM